MPTYEYECKSCGHNFEVFQSMKEEALTDCPQCGKELRRLINGGGGIIFKGSGFYVNDKNKSAGKTAAAKPDNAGAKGAGSAARGEGTASETKAPSASSAAGCAASCPAAAGSCPAAEKAGDAAKKAAG
jgi:putative FmdB family regulatory protein